jgi:PAS domain S-box-containing protein
LNGQITYDELASIRVQLEQQIASLEEKLKQDAELRQLEEKYKRLVESLTEEYIFYLHDSAGMITYVSPSITKILGYSQEESMRNYREFLTDHKMNQEALNRSKASLKGLVQPPFMNELYHIDGTTRIFYNTELPIYDENGRVTGVEGIAHDVTKKYTAEEELRKQDEILKLLVDTIEEVFWTHDLKTDQLLFISSKYELVFGRTTESLYQNPGSFLKSIHKDDREYVKKAYKRMLTGTGMDMEYRIIDPSGNEKQIWTRSFVIRDDRNKPSLSIGTAQDITERKKSQHEKDLLAAIVENVEDHAVIKDTNLKVIASNSANTLAAGKKTASQLIGKTDLEIYGDFDHVRQYMDDDRKAMKLKHGETLVSDQVFVYPNGRKIHSLVKKFPVYDEQNKLIGVASISRDVTDYKNTLKELYKSEHKYRLLIDNQGEGIGMVNPDDKFIFVNPKAEEIFGVASGKLIGKTVFDFLSPENRKFIRDQTNLRKNGAQNTYELEIIRPDKEKRQILVTATPQFEEGEFSGTFAVFRDMEGWKTQETSSANDKFISIIAHDLKNPLSSITGFSDLLMKDYSSYDQEEVLTFVKMIHGASRQAQNLLNNLLDWSRSQTGRIRFEPGDIDLSQVLESVFKLYKLNAHEKNLQLDIRVSKGSMAYGDQNMVSTIVRNLISNAIKFTRPGGRITVSSKSSRNETQFIVADTGIGIPEELTGKLFRIDEQVTRTGTANEEGTGLGLILCMEFARRNNGTLGVRSKPGKGSTFTLRLPRQKPEG